MAGHENQLRRRYFSEYKLRHLPSKTAGSSCDDCSHQFVPKFDRVGRSILAPISRVITLGDLAPCLDKKRSSPTVSLFTPAALAQRRGTWNTYGLEERDSRCRGCAWAR